MLHTITHHTDILESKPTTEYIKKISKYLNIIKSLSIKDYAEYVGKYTWSGSEFGVSTYPNIRNMDNWIKSSVFTIDIDIKHTLDDIFSISKNLNLTPNIIGETFSSTEETPKRRAIFFFDGVVDDRDKYHFLIRNLIKAFAGIADKQCSDCCRMFYPIKNIEFLNEVENNLDAFYDVMNLVQIANDSNKTRKVIFNKNTDKSNFDKNETEFTKIRHFNFEKAVENIKILQDLVNGVWLTHNDLFGIATNLNNVVGGLRWMRAYMDMHNASGATNYTDNNFAIIPYVKYRNYNPKALEYFSPYVEDHQYTNIISATVNVRGVVEVLDRKQRLTLIEAEQALRNAYMSALNSMSVGEVLLIKAATGSGKTKLLETINTVINGAVIACPTHKLKDELKNRLNFATLSTPEIPKNVSVAVRKNIENLFTLGRKVDALRYMHDISRGVVQTNLVDRHTIHKYYEDMKKVYDSLHSFVLTTHVKAITTNFNNHDTIIFDECPLAQVAKVDSFMLSDIIKLNNYLKRDKACNGGLIALRNHLIDEIEQGDTYKVSELVQAFSIDIDQVVKYITKYNISAKVVDFLMSDSFTKCDIDPNLITFIRKNDFPIDKKVIILSASSPDVYYKTLLGDRFSCVDLTAVETVGKQIQHTKKTYSKQCMKRDTAKIDDLNAKTNDSVVITHKSYKDSFDNTTEMHFNNCSGYDELSGKNIAVIGTPNKPSYYYTLFAALIGHHTKKSKIKYGNRKVTWRGMRFTMATFDDNVLADIQCALVECELLQAAGRNRVLRKNCVTQIYSSFPLYTTDEFVND
jgi:hypothetical protein